MTQKWIQRCILGFALSTALGVSSLDASEAQMKVIRAKYNQIESLTGLKKSVFKYQADEPDGHTVERYVGENGEVQKVVMMAGGDHGTIRFSFYYQAGKPIFGFMELRRYDYPDQGTIDSERDILVREEERVYFQGSQCIELLVKRVKTREPKKATALLAKTPNVSERDEQRESFLHDLAKQMGSITTDRGLKEYVIAP